MLPPKRITDFMDKKEKFVETQKLFDKTRAFLKKYAPELLPKFEEKVGLKTKRPLPPKDLQNFFMTPIVDPLLKG